MYKIIPTERFSADVKYYIKKKHYTKIGEDIRTVTDELQNGNLIGDEISGLRVESDGHTFKVRAANSDMKAGLSKGYRIIYYAVREDGEIYLLTIYSKKDDNRIPNNKEIVGLVAKYCL